MSHHSRSLLCSGLLSAVALIPSIGTAAVIASYDFNTGSDTEGWTSLAVTGLTTSAGFITGTASGNDPQLLKNAGSLTVGAGQTWDTVVFRLGLGSRAQERLGGCRNHQHPRGPDRRRIQQQRGGDKR